MVAEAALEFDSRVDATLQMTCELARALIGAHQAAMSLIVASDWVHARKEAQACATYQISGYGQLFMHSLTGSP